MVWHLFSFINALSNLCFATSNCSVLVTLEVSAILEAAKNLLERNSWIELSSSSFAASINMVKIGYLTQICPYHMHNIRGM